VTSGRSMEDKGRGETGGDPSDFIACPLCSGFHYLWKLSTVDAKSSTRKTFSNASSKCRVCT
jgi:hypothetical protein